MHHFANWLRRYSAPFLTVFAGSIFLTVALTVQAQEPNTKHTTVLESPLQLETKHIVGGKHDGEALQIGKYAVYENRIAQEGRIIHLNIVILPTLAENENDRAPDPIFVIAGGPGQSAAEIFYGFLDSPLRINRDLVFISQRGTDGDNALRCNLPSSDDNLQGYLEPLFVEKAFRSCMEELEKTADLTQYGTPEAMDDYNEIRQALGYEKINLMGGSYGTRASLVYMRRHPETVRTAILNGIAPIEFVNPLFHAKGAQEALDKIFNFVKNDERYRKAYPNLREEFNTVMVRLMNEPAQATVRHPATGEKIKVKLTRAAFAEALRVMMYYNNRDVPLLIHHAFQGDFDAFAQRGIEGNRALRNILAMGMLLCVTCAEDVARITPEMIIQETANTFLGDDRVRRQRAVCEFWPKSDLPADYGEPVSVNIPVLILSGTLDPVTPPRWGDITASSLPLGLSVVVPGTHGVHGPCIQLMIDELLESGTTIGLDTSCTKDIKMWRFTLPNDATR